MSKFWDWLVQPCIVGVGDAFEVREAHRVIGDYWDAVNKRELVCNNDFDKVVFDNSEHKHVHLDDFDRAISLAELKLLEKRNSDYY